MTDPIPRMPVSAYQKRGNFPVKFRRAGEGDGPVFQGQKMVVPCANCGVRKIDCAEGLGNRVAAISNALTWHARIRFGWVVNEHCPLGWREVFPEGITGVEFVPGEGGETSEIGGRPGMDWEAARCREHARFTYGRVMAAIGPQAWPDAPAVAIVARFHRAARFDLPRLANAAGRAAHEAGEGRVFVLADQHREDISILLRRLWNIDAVLAAAPELTEDLDRSPEATRLFIQDWQTALAARQIIALDGPTSLLHPARASGARIHYA